MKRARPQPPELYLQVVVHARLYSAHRPDTVLHSVRGHLGNFETVDDSVGGRHLSSFPGSECD